MPVRRSSRRRLHSCVEQIPPATRNIMYSYVSMYLCQSAGHRGCTLLPLWYVIAVVVRYCRCGTLLPLWSAVAVVVRYYRYTCSRLMHPIAIVVATIVTTHQNDDSDEDDTNGNAETDGDDDSDGSDKNDKDDTDGNDENDDSDRDDK